MTDDDRKDAQREAWAKFSADDGLRGEWSRIAFDAGYAAGLRAGEAAERGRCAKVCEDIFDGGADLWDSALTAAIEAIRAKE